MTAEQIEQREQQVLESTRDRFIDERRCGFKDGAGNFHQPVTRAEAAARWAANEARFLKAIKTDVELRKRFGLPAIAN